MLTHEAFPIIYSECGFYSVIAFLCVLLSGVMEECCRDACRDLETAALPAPPLRGTACEIRDHWMSPPFFLPGPKGTSLGTQHQDLPSPTIVSLQGVFEDRPLLPQK